MAKNNGNDKRTVVFDKKMGEKREQDKNLQQQLSKNQSKSLDDKSKSGKSSNLRRGIELAVIVAIILFSLLIACYSILQSLGVINNGQNGQVASLDGLQSSSSASAGANNSSATSSAAATSAAATATSSAGSQSNNSGSNNGSTNGTGVSTASNRSYIYTAVKGDSVTKLARRAMVDYLAASGISLTRQQKLYFETNLVKISHPNERVYRGTVREFKVVDLDRLAREAQSLTSAQQAAWNKYLKGYPL